MSGPFEFRLHGAVALAHWYVGQALLKLKNGHYEDAATAMQNADKFVSVVGREVTPDLEPLPESLRNALEAHGIDPDTAPRGVRSAESWPPPIKGDPKKLTEGLDELIDETLKRMGAEPLQRDDDA